MTKVTSKDVGRRVMMLKCSSTTSGRTGDHMGGTDCFVKHGTKGTVLGPSSKKADEGFMVQWTKYKKCYVCKNDKWKFLDEKRMVKKKKVIKKTKLTFTGVACKKCGIKPLTNPESIEAKLCQSCSDEEDDDLGL